MVIHCIQTCKDNCSFHAGFCIPCLKLYKDYLRSHQCLWKNQVISNLRIKESFLPPPSCWKLCHGLGEFYFCITHTVVYRETKDNLYSQSLYVSQNSRWICWSRGWKRILQRNFWFCWFLISCFVEISFNLLKMNASFSR